MRTLLVLLALCPMMAMIDPSERVLAFLKAWDRANERCGLKRKQMAGYQGLSEAQLSRQMSMESHAHPSMARAALAPDAVYVCFAQELCDLTGTARVVTDHTIDRHIHVVEMLTQAITRGALISVQPQKETV